MRPPNLEQCVNQISKITYCIPRYVLYANFNIILHEMNNDRSYYISDNSRIRLKYSDNHDGSSIDVRGTTIHLAMHMP